MEGQCEAPVNSGVGRAARRWSVDGMVVIERADACGYVATKVRRLTPAASVLSETMEIKEQRQAGPIADPVGAYIAVLRPIFASILGSIAAEQLTAYESRGDLKLL